MKPRHAGWVIAVLLLGLVVGCAHAAPYDADQMYGLAVALSKLSRAVDAVVATEEAPEGLSEEELLNRATAHDLSLRAPFAQYKLHVLRQGRNSAVLVCTPDGKEALLEDAGCTGRFEHHWWRDTLDTPCAFTLDLLSTCGGR